MLTPPENPAGRSCNTKVFKMAAQMKKFAIVTIGTLAFSAFALSGSDDGREWRSASLKQKNAFAVYVVSRLGANYPASEMRACLDAFYAPPTSGDIQVQKISDIAALCHTTMK